MMTAQNIYPDDAVECAITILGVEVIRFKISKEKAKKVAATISDTLRTPCSLDAGNKLEFKVIGVEGISAVK